jgi:dolichyl-phosphate beta-glucosyltransferase
VFATCAAIVIGLAVYDTQCGAKLFRRSAAAAVFSKPFVGRWVFDVEIFTRFAALLGENADRVLIEVPLMAWVDQRDSRIRPMDFVRAPIDLARIAYRYGVGRRTE